MRNSNPPLASSRPRSGRLRPVLLILAAAAVAALLLITLRVGPRPAVEIDPALPGIGPATPVTVRAAVGGRGLAGLRLELHQEGREPKVLAEREHQPRPAWAFWGPRTTEEAIEVEVGAKTVQGLAEGEATLRAVAERAPTWLRRPAPAVAEVELPVRLRPPALAVTSSQHYARQGGSGVVVYRDGEGTERSGVEAGGRWFPGHPLPGAGDRRHFAFYAVPYDLADGSEVRLVAEDGLGNRAERAFLDIFKPAPYSEGTIQLSDGFMARVVPEILSESPGFEDRGGDLANYLAINGGMRAANAERLEELAERSREAFLWEGAFLPMPNGQVMSPFAERRAYIYQGEEVDEQFHLGYDLASVRRAPVPAANGGVVVLSEYFGIYGNAVIVDHGYGLASLYGHLSEISVEEGQRVERGETVGLTGETGLAGGDHLHFAILLQGLPVDPVEWWDPKWIRDRIASKLGAALDAESPESTTADPG